MTDKFDELIREACKLIAAEEAEKIVASDVEVPPLERLERSRPFFMLIDAELEKDLRERDLDKIKSCSDVEAAVYAEDLSLEVEIDVTGTPLCPGRPDLCLGSGSFAGFEICCDECDYFLKCFPEWEKGDPNG